MEDKFEPIDSDELAAAGAHQKGSAWTPIVPVPDGRKLPRSLLVRCCPPGHSFAVLWPYTTPSGAISRATMQPTGPGKNSGRSPIAGTALRRPGGAAKRFRSPARSITSRRGVPVLVVEGEAIPFAARTRWIQNPSNPIS